MQTITINSISYPCFPTMGAIVRFRDLTGREITEIKPHEVSAVCRYLYCVVLSACRRTNTPFDVSEEEFLDALTPEDINRWASTFAADEDEALAAEDEKND